VVNLRCADGLVREVHARVSRAGIAPLEPVPCGGPAGEWLRRYEAHERAALAALRAPSRETLRRALALDPCVGPGIAERVAEAIAALRGIG
jgi:hypothetical protein